PTTLLTLGQVWKTLSPEQQTALNVVFVSVDPERDTPTTLQPYMQYFNSSFIALTGNPESLQRLSAAVSAFYAKAQAHEDNLGYLMNHSANIILIDPVGRYRGFIEPPFENQRLEKIIPLLLSVPALVTVPALTNSQ
ncbi:MAG: SCO family protein, partial [Oleibacter sp.]|nr:SCO family protein [Thalassolituus sp.]